jgi:hypothetical protein
MNVAGGAYVPRQALRGSLIHYEYLNNRAPGIVHDTVHRSH